MSDIVLSSSVRSNLLNLQQTSDLIASTQQRLSTGRKVNSALDNPTNFFTASSLNARANDLTNLLDGLSNGIKTIEAADNGLKAITNTIETLQSTARQARQDKSFETKTFKFGDPTSGSISFSGGAVGSDPVSISFDSGTVASPTTLDGAAATFGTLPSGTISINGTSVDIRGTTAAVATTLTGSGGNGYSNSTGGDVTFDIDGTTITIANTEDLTDAATAIDGLAGYSASVNGDGELDISKADGSDIVIDNASGVTLAALGFGAGNTTSTNGEAAFTATVATALADIDAAGIAGLTASNNAGQISLSLASGEDLTVSGDSALLGALGFGGGALSSLTSDNGTVADDPKTVDDVVRLINNNDDLEGKVRASNVNGQLRVENLSTADLSVDGIDAEGVIDGTTNGEATIGGNSTRNNLVSQFNDLREQLDRLADDAGFNGINLLRGDKLSLGFNEDGTSSIDIQAKDASGATRNISSDNLGIRTATSEEFGDDGELDEILDELGSALTEIRSQSSSFGSNLSSVQNRQDFTRETINTLQTGADNLTLADINEEAANLLALQTRQQLSNRSLSLASQADQGVLRLL